MLAPGNAPRSHLSYWVPLILVAIVFGIAAGWRISLPGLYMDAVDPDYLVVRILNSHGYQIPPWVLPGNYLGKRFPILTSLYHSTLQLWLSLPAFLLFGTSLVGLRVTHALFGFAIIWSMYAALTERELPTAWAAAACAALALDPAFVYSFRTQNQLSTVPVLWIFLSVLQIDRAMLRRQDSCARHLRLSGFFFGLAVAGYFTFLFFLPAMVGALWSWYQRDNSVSRLGALRLSTHWVTGLCWGLSFYIVGYALLAISQGGLGGLFAYISTMQSTLGAFGSQLSLIERIGFAWQQIVAVFSNSWNSALMFDDYTPVPAAPLKLAILLILPVMLWSVAEYRSVSSGLLRLLLGLQLSFFTISLIFGSRLGGHHYVCLLPLSYAALMVGLHCMIRVPAMVSASRSPWMALSVVVLASLIAINVAGDRQMTAKLSETHGIGLYSDAINHFAEDLLQTKRDHFLILPDWGLYMPIVFLTGANIQISTDEDINAAKHFLCHKRNVSVALINGDRAVRFSDWQRRLLLKAPIIEDYRQFDGKVVFQVGTFVADSDDSSCVK
jgi:uncharacterized membrane protein